MCSRGSDDEGDHLMPTISPPDSCCSTCRKCNESPANVLLQNKFPYCRNCFIVMVSHKYRSTLGKSKLMKHGDRVLVAYSGSSSSVSLLHMIKMAALDGKKKKIKTETVVLFIDDMIPKIVDEIDRLRIISEIGESLKQYDFDKYCVPLDSIFEDYLTLFPLESDIQVLTNSNVQNLMGKCKSSTSVNDLLRKLRYHLLYLTAKKLKCNKVFLAETSDHLAVSIISNVALGRGAQLPFDVGFRDHRYEGVDFLRPLQECSKKEVTFYNEFNGLRPVTVPNVSTKVNRFDNIQKLTEDFITNLGISFPSTVHTVVATGSKLVLNQDKVRAVCGLCKMKKHIKMTDMVADERRMIHDISLSDKREIRKTFEKRHLTLKEIENANIAANSLLEGFVDSVDSNALSSSSATKLSSLVSALGPNQFDGCSLSPANCTGSSENVCCSSKTTSHPLNNGLQSLCYGCQLVRKDCDELDLWPSSIRKAVEEESCLSAMREEIKDFLL